MFSFLCGFITHLPLVFDSLPVALVVLASLLHLDEAKRYLALPSADLLAWKQTRGGIIFSPSNINLPVLFFHSHPSVFVSSGMTSLWFEIKLVIFCPVNVNVKWPMSYYILRITCALIWIIISCTCLSVCIVSAPLDFLHIWFYLLLWVFSFLSKVTCKQSDIELYKSVGLLLKNKYNYMLVYNYICITRIIYLWLNHLIFYYFVVQQNQKCVWCANVSEWVGETFR